MIGRVVLTPDHWVDPPHDRVTRDGRALAREERIHIALQARPAVCQLLSGVRQFVGTVGRFDLDTSGMLLLTNDHALADRLTDPKHHAEKEYLVKAAQALTGEQPLTITEGHNRQVRRMIEAIGGRVLKLVHTRIGPLALEGLEMGKCRVLSKNESPAHWCVTMKRASGRSAAW